MKPLAIIVLVVLAAASISAVPMARRAGKAYLIEGALQAAKSKSAAETANAFADSAVRAILDMQGCYRSRNMADAMSDSPFYTIEFVVIVNVIDTRTTSTLSAETGTTTRTVQLIRESAKTGRADQTKEGD